jgi:hypothetical protein
MSKTKIQHVNRAFEWLVISGITSKPSAEENAIGLSVLEDMMNEFKSRNICSSYVFEDEPNPNTDSEIDDAYNNATGACLAVRLANMYGKEAPMTLQRQATQALSNWSATTSKTNQIQPSRRQPRGSGNTFRFSNWTRYYRSGNPAPISCTTFDLKVGETDFFGVDFTPYLLEGATITSFTVDSTNGINVIQSVQDGNIINLECKGADAGYQTVTITVTTSTGRINPETINFNITET